MKLILFNELGIKFNVPENWNEVSFRSLSNYLASIENGDIQIISISKLLSVPVDTLMNKIPQAKLLEIMNILYFIKEIPSPPMQLDFTCNGKKYNLHKSFKEMTAGQYADIDWHSQNKKGLDYVPYIMAICFFQKGEKTYSQAVPFIKKRAKEFEQLPCTLIIGISNFFLFLQNLSKSNFQKFLAMSEATMAKLLEEAGSYSQSTGGEVSFISSQKMTSLKSMQSQISQFARS